MSLMSVRKVYNAYAWFYDAMFGWIFHPGRHASVNFVNKHASSQANVLELGVGTGLSLPLYRADLNITGVDISEKMLKKAEKRVEDKTVKAQVTLKVMDAANLEFADNSFDFVVAMYVASVVPDVDAFLEEISRVCKPSGEIIFVNHFASETPVIRFFEKKLAKINQWIGFDSSFSIHSILNFSKLKVLETYNTNLFGYWKVLRCKVLTSKG